LSYLSDTNRLLGLGQEAIEQAREAMEIFERLGDTVKQAECFIDLAWASYDDNQLDAAEEAALRGIELLPEDGKQYQACQAIVFLAMYIPPRANRRRLRTISR
jgi:tetratricopeptide (TPR) repeat protein